MAKSLTLKVKVSWWLMYFYLPLLILTVKFCKLFNEEIEPDWNKVQKVFKRGITVIKGESLT